MVAYVGGPLEELYYRGPGSRINFNLLHASYDYVEFHVVSRSSLYFLSRGLHTAHGDQTICQVVAYLGFKKTMGNFIMKPLPQKVAAVTSLRWSFSDASR